jgi:hypothetical protein
MWNRFDDVLSASTRCGSGNGASPPRPISVPARPCEIDSSENDRFWFLRSTYWPGEGQSCGMLIPGDLSHNTASRSGSGYGSGLRRSALTTLKIAVVAPMPIASDSTMTKVKPGVRRKVRSAYWISCWRSLIARLRALRDSKSEYAKRLVEGKGVERRPVAGPTAQAALIRRLNERRADRRWLPE